MLNKLFEIEKELPTILRNAEFKMASMFIDYHPPIVERIWFQFNKYRVLLHKIHQAEMCDPLFHPHPRESAVRLIKGSYKMGIGHSPSDEIPPIDCYLHLAPGTCYEMSEPDGWHYVNPIDDYVYSLMITGEKFARKMPLEPDKPFRELTETEILDIMAVFKNYYNGK